MTTNWQLAAGASVAGGAGQSLVCINCPVGTIAIAEIASGAPPVLVSVSVTGVLTLPTPGEVKPSERPLSKELTGVFPPFATCTLPLKPSVCVVFSVPPLLSVTISVPELLVALGVYTMLIWQVCPVVSVNGPPLAEHDRPVTAKSDPENTTVVPFRGAAPMLVSVAINVELGVPTAVLVRLVSSAVKTPLGVPPLPLKLTAWFVVPVTNWLLSVMVRF